MRLCLLPLRVRYRDPQRNFRHLEERLSELARSKLDLVCLPECALTGYLYFDEPSPDPERWEREERKVYLDGVRVVGVTTAIVNSLEINADEFPDFGGALLVNGAGRMGQTKLLSMSYNVL
jgi:predicted amidohydrolase